MQKVRDPERHQPLAQQAADETGIRRLQPLILRKALTEFMVTIPDPGKEHSSK